jgi:carboxylesterase
VEEIFIIGLSMGGVLSLYASSYLPTAGTIVMSTPYDLPQDPRIPLLPLLWHLFPLADKGKDDWRNPDAVKEHISYAKYPTRSLIELQKLLDQMRTSLPSLTAPVLLFQSRDDETVPAENMPRLHGDIGSFSKEMVWVEDSGHVLTREPVQDFVFRTIYAFISQHTTLNKS